MKRPETVSHLLQVAENTEPDTIYEISFRAWQLKDIHTYITHLERDTNGQHREQ